MNGIRFYEEFKDDARRKSRGSVVAAIVCNGVYYSEGYQMVEAVASVFDQPNGPVAGTGASRTYLRTRCKRISESQARKIHSALFERLDREA